MCAVEMDFERQDGRGGDGRTGERYGGQAWGIN